MSFWKCFSPIKKLSKRSQTSAPRPDAHLNGDHALHIAAAADAAEQEEMATAIALSLSAAEASLDGNVDRRLFEEPSPGPNLSSSTANGGATPSCSSGSAPSADPTIADQAKALDKLSEIIANCQATGQSFIDPDFRPVDKSLYANGKCRHRDAARLAIVQHYNTADVEKVEWRSAGEILQRPDDLQLEYSNPQEMMSMVQQFARMVEWRVFQNDPAPTDISQGGLGNCWFCGSLAAVAEKPHLIRRLFIDSYSSAGELSPKGAYLIRLCDGGRWDFNIIDGLLPCNRHNMLAFSGARHNQLWVPLLEKAYAKSRCYYEAIEGGTPAEGLRLFTGWPSIVQELQVSQQRETTQRADDSQSDNDNALQTQAICHFAGEDILWSRLESAYESRLIICGSCGHVDGLTDEQYRSVGLSPSHCYSIVQVATALQGRLRLLKLRNPWGTGRKWNGAFSDSDSERWTEEIKREIDCTDLGAEGVFWMRLEDIRRHFTSITICPYRDGWAEMRLSGCFTARVVDGFQQAYILESETACDALVSLMQQEERASRTMMTADFGLALFKIPRGRAAGIGRELTTLQDLSLMTTVKRKVQDTLVTDCFLGAKSREGAVLAVPLSFNQRSPPMDPGAGCDKDFTFACFAPHPMVIRSIRLSADAHRDALAAHIRRVATPNRLFQSVKVYQATDAGLAVLVENSSMEFVLIESRLENIINMTVSRGVEANAQGELSLHTHDSIPPMHAMVIFVAAAMPSGHNYRFNSTGTINRGGVGDIHVPALAEPTDAMHTPFFLEGVGPQAAGRSSGPRYYDHRNDPQFS